MKKIIFGLTIIVMISSCKKDKAAEIIIGLDCEGVEMSFAQDILPIFTQNCATSYCHSDANAANGYAWTSYGNIAQQSRLDNILCAINHRADCSNMPKFGAKLPDSTIRKIECWIDNGFPND